MARDNLSVRVRTTFDGIAVAEAMEEATVDLVSRVATEIQKGIKYALNRKNNLDGNNPSLPGEPPAKVTGTLGRSWTTSAKRAKRYGGRVVLRLGTNANYARPLEFGSKKRNLAPRPYVRPVLASRGLRNAIARHQHRAAQLAKSILSRKIREREIG